MNLTKISLRMNNKNLGGFYRKYFLIVSAAIYLFTFKSHPLTTYSFPACPADSPNVYAPTLALPIYYKVISIMLPPLPALQFLI
jgi:hypothetical protein